MGFSRRTESAVCRAKMVMSLPLTRSLAGQTCMRRPLLVPRESLSPVGQAGTLQNRGLRADPVRKPIGGNLDLCYNPRATVQDRMW